MSDAQDQITGFWSTVAPEYEAHGGNVPQYGSDDHEAWVTAIRTALPDSPCDLLDVATGTGFVALIAAGLGHRVTGIDLSPQMLSVASRTAEQRGLGVRFFEGDAVNPDIEPRSFDVLTNRHFLWTLREPETAIANWRGLLRPGGMVVAFDGFWFASPPAESDADSPQDVGLFERHYTNETRAALPLMALNTIEPIEEMFQRAGFSDVKSSELPSLINKGTGDTVPYVIVARVT